MASHIKVTLTRRGPVLVEYQCSRCGAPNRHVQVITHRREFQVNGTGSASRSKAEQLEVEYAHEMDEGLIDKVAAVQNPANPRRYDEAAFTCACSSCGHREPWAHLEEPRITLPLRIIGIICLIACFVISNRPNSALKQPLFTAAFSLMTAGFVSCPLIRWGNKLLRKSQIKKLPPASIPVVTPQISMEKRKAKFWEQD